jgi:hypothetical protein
MKTKPSKTKVRGVGEIETPETNPVLLHFLSPLERAAYQHQFRRFTYNLDGINLILLGRPQRALATLRYLP